MANVNEITVGSEVKLTEAFFKPVTMMNLLVMGKASNGFGVVKAVEPTSAEIARYKELNPNADGTNKVIYYDAKAERHFITAVNMLDTLIY